MAIQFRYVPGQFNWMAICTSCDRDASTVRMSYYVEAAISGNPLICDECRRPTTPENGNG